MFVLKLVVLLSITTSFVICEDVFSLLPKKFELDDPEECNNGIFCKISVALTPYNSSTRPESWSKIEDMKRDYHYFRHDKLLHGRCFRKKHSKSLEDIVKDEYATKYRNESLKGNVETYVCMEKGRLLLDDIDYWDLFFISIGIIYVVFMVIATAYTYSAEHQKDNFFIKFLSIFSIIKIWGELRKPIKNEDFQNLKSIQGIRTMTMMLIISLHAFYGNMFTFLQNPEYVENIYTNWITRCLVTVFTFLVQSFFLISAWLLTIQLTNILRKNGKLTLKDILLLGLNRYFRLLPVLAILVAALRSNVAHDLISYTNEDIMKREVDICRDYWWKNILFIQNIYEPDKICSSVTWYLATDYQLYLLTLGIFYISHKLKTNVKYLISLVVITTVATQVAIITNTDFQGFLRLVPKTANLEDMIVSKAFTLSYIPIWCNTITYMIGILFGTIYCNHKGEKIFNDNMKKIAWFFGFFGLPILAVFITSFQYDTRFFELLVSILARPMFGLGIGIGILGMASKTGGLVKMICESEILVFLANFCYCVYIFHYAFVFLRILGEDKLVELSIFYIAKYTLIDYTLSFSFGALMYMAVEHPFIQLQKMVFPQVTTKKLNFNGLPKSSISTVS